MTTASTPLRRGRTARRLSPLLVLVFVVSAATAVFVLARQDWSTGSTSAPSLRGSGVGATQSRTVPSFTAIDLAGSNDVTVHVGEEQAVVVEADENLIDLVTTDVRSGRLVVSTKGSFTTRHPMTVDVTVPTLDAVLLSGSGVMTVDGVDGERLAVQVPGSGLVSISGTADRLDVHLAGSGDVRLQNLVARDVAATLSGSGRIDVYATGSLQGSVTGTGVLVYGGNPSSVQVDVTGTGAVTKR